MFKICNNDPLVKELRNTFGANVVRIPRSGITPLMVVLKTSRKGLKILGHLSNLLEGQPDLSAIKITPSTLAFLKNNRTSSMETGFGLELLGGYFQGFGLPGIKLDTSLKNAKEVSLSFPNASYHSVDNLAMGVQLSKYKVNLKNPVAQTFVGNKANQVLIIDSVMMSNNFALNVEKTFEGNFDFEVGKIKNILDIKPGKLDVKKNSDRSVSFEGAEQLCFAFSCIRFSVDPVTGELKNFEVEKNQGVLEKAKKRTILYPRSSVMVDLS